MEIDQDIERKLRFAGLVLILCIVFQGTAYGKKYYLYGKPQNGTKFKQAIYESELPLRKSYLKLSDEQKLLVRNNYEELAKDSIPPFPRKGIGKLLAPYVKKFRWAGGQTESGYIKILIDQDGNASSYRSVGDLSANAARFLARRAKQIKFTPGLCEGEPCEMEFVLEIKPIMTEELKVSGFSS